MIVDLPPNCVDFIRKSVESGRYISEEQVIVAALSRLEGESEEGRRWPASEELRRMALEGCADLDEGRWVEGDEAARRLYKHLELATSKNR